MCGDQENVLTNERLEAISLSIYIFYVCFHFSIFLSLHLVSLVYFL